METTNTVTAAPVVDNRPIITFKGRDIKVTPVAPGVMKKSDTVFYIQDRISGEWLYCSNTRLAKLTAKAGSIEAVGTGYTGRESKKQVRAQEAKVAAEAKPATPAGESVVIDNTPAQEPVATEG